MKFLYNFLISVFYFAIIIASLVNKKAKKWLNGRKNVFESLLYSVAAGDEIIWIHCASLGEFEQGRPIIEGLKKAHPNYKILLSFFSPSGYEIRKNYEYADIVTYLPLDTYSNAKKFISIINPKLVIFVKYEFWFNYLAELKKQRIPVIFISSIFRPDQYFFKSYSSWFRKALKNIDHFFVQNEESKELLQNIGINQVTTCGDTRFDRVYQLAQNPLKFEIINLFKGESKLIVAGSTWPQDEEQLIPIINKFPEIKFIIAPHEVHPSRIEQIQKKIGSKAGLLSSAKINELDNYNVLIVDSIGVLAHVYQYATIAYIGGGFKTGLHNIQEPVTFGIPVVFGPKFQKFQEANDLIKLKGAFSIKNSNELLEIFSNLIVIKDLYQNACQTNKNYVNQSVGASKIILNYLNELLEN
ncbi:MAG: 3-deoxy-D-manno-octulosonic acid transferase [Bacteroidetes bacterium]|nr:3-deoxy-D-manno-octulosonic acid transferase [Bacteroidota bacterium]